MNYTVKKLDGRYAHRKQFEYCADFAGQPLGPTNFHTVMQWMIDTYGYSAEVRDFMWIKSMLKKRQQFNVLNSDVPSFINPQWSWSNGGPELRLYFATDKELSFFKLKWIKNENN